MPEELKKEIQAILKKSPVEEDVKHADVVLKWALALKPDADIALQIAAFSHDIDRAISGKTEGDMKSMSEYAEFKRQHAIRSAQYIAEILNRHHYHSAVIEKVKHLVSLHEVGGDHESDILRDADSIGYFEYNIIAYLRRHGEERTKKKIGFMYSRMSQTAKEKVKELKLPNPTVEKLFREVIG